MACGGCNSATPVSKEQVENILNKALKELSFLDDTGVKALIQELIDNGKIQGGLLTCEGGNLSNGSKVPTCDTLVDTKISEILVNKGEKQVTLVLSDGDTKEFSLKGMFGDTKVSTRTEPNGDIVLTVGGSSVTIPSVKVNIAEDDNKFIFTNQNGSTIEMKKHKASVRVFNTFGNIDLGYLHEETTM